VLLLNKVVAADWLQPDAPLLLRDALGEATVAVKGDAPTLPLLQDDRVAVLGTLRKQADGTVSVEAARIHWLGAL
jgi:hypothetical protein